MVSILSLYLLNASGFEPLFSHSKVTSASDHQITLYGEAWLQQIPGRTSEILVLKSTGTDKLLHRNLELLEDTSLSLKTAYVENTEGRLTTKTKAGVMIKRLGPGLKGDQEARPTKIC